MSRMIIAPGRIEGQYWRDLWRYRELFCFLTWRNLLVRYKQTAVGAAWGLVRPILTMIVLTVVFGKLAKMPDGGVPYPILVLCAMLPWQFFASAITDSSNSLVANINLVSKVYFPRLVIPASTILTSLVDLGVTAIILAVLMVWYGVVPAWGIVLLPFFIMLAFAAAFGAGLWISAMMVRFRDFRYIVPFMVQFGLYISPVGFFSDVVPEKWRLLYSLNPMVGVIDGFRWALLGGQHDIYWPGMLLSIATVSLLLITGIRYFRSTERTFADVI